MPQQSHYPADLRPGDRIVQPDPDEDTWPEVRSVGASVVRDGLQHRPILLVGDEEMEWPDGTQVLVSRED